MFQVFIEWDGRTSPVGPRYRTRGDAEWAVATWRQLHGCNGKDTGFWVRECPEPPGPAHANPAATPAA